MKIWNFDFPIWILVKGLERKMRYYFRIILLLLVFILTPNITFSQDKPKSKKDSCVLTVEPLYTTPMRKIKVKINEEIMKSLESKDQVNVFIDGLKAKVEEANENAISILVPKMNVFNRTEAPIELTVEKGEEILSCKGTLTIYPFMLDDEIISLREAGFDEDEILEYLQKKLDIWNEIVIENDCDDIDLLRKGRFNFLMSPTQKENLEKKGFSENFVDKVSGRNQYRITTGISYIWLRETKEALPGVIIRFPFFPRPYLHPKSKALLTNIIERFGADLGYTALQAQIDDENSNQPKDINLLTGGLSFEVNSVLKVSYGIAAELKDGKLLNEQTYIGITLDLFDFSNFDFLPTRP